MNTPCEEPDRDRPSQNLSPTATFRPCLCPAVTRPYQRRGKQTPPPQVFAALLSQLPRPRRRPCQDLAWSHPMPVCNFVPSRGLAYPVSLSTFILTFAYLSFFAEALAACPCPLRRPKKPQQDSSPKFKTEAPNHNPCRWSGNSGSFLSSTFGCTAQLHPASLTGHPIMESGEGRGRPHWRS
ncbi:hypothetical protein E2C01_032523 [Portunus trituberculatus]|uniref:Uncharacterized protein n=1 Tax=Portunus trituberculatus TaxID=210409 RepID=A0A5B7F1M1_PORTR|nr:hypothetical protein [Portunus trituberculatus]